MEHPEKSDVLVEIGRRIRDRRNQLRLTQEELEEKAGLGAKYSSVIETASKSMHLETFIKICDALELDYNFAITGNCASALSQEIAKRLSGRSEEEIRLFLQFWDTFIPPAKTDW